MIYAPKGQFKSLSHICQASRETSAVYNDIVSELSNPMTCTTENIRLLKESRLWTIGR